MQVVHLSYYIVFDITIKNKFSEQG
jgi:hypothetical protein